MRVAILFAVLGLAGCAVETGAPDTDESANAEAAAKKLDPCAAVRCMAGTHCEVQKGRASCVADAPACATDADCRLFSNYCGGCSCDALLTTASNPVCSGTTVACFADPCGGKAAVCVSGACQVSTGTL